MGRDDRPEDETVDEGGEPDSPSSGEEPEGLSLFDDEPDEASGDEPYEASADEPESEAAGAEPGSEADDEPPEAGAASEAEGGAGAEPADATAEPGEGEPGEEDAAEGEEPPRRRRRGIYALGALGAVIAVGVFLVGWTRVASSDTFCASCHEVEPFARSAARSVHADVTCLSCHTGPGLAGAVRYIPTFVREVITEFTPIGFAHGVLQARDCESCHDNIATTPELAAAHATDAKCASCHGDVAHPPFRLAGFARPVEAAEGQVHPRLYVQTHGVDVAARPDSCVECHEETFCEACHFRETYPHPDDWIAEHGPTQQDLGIQACEGCHPQTFCAGCHGTEIPHNDRWLSEHWRDLEDAPVTPCLLCHPKTDCTTCHSEHGVHNEQDLFFGGGA